MFILLSAWMIRKGLMKHHCSKKNFIVAKVWKTLQMQITGMEKEFANTLGKYKNKNKKIIR